MDRLVDELKELKEGPIGDIVRQRMNEFELLGRGTEEDLFKELCFCILTANYSAERGIRIQKEIDLGFLSLPLDELARKLRELGHRYPEIRAKYIVEARKYLGKLKKVLESFDDEALLRDWLVKNVKGLGYKEASHFLRNIGFKNVAIIDFHIIDLLVKYGIIERPRSLTRKKYMEIEDILRKIAEISGLTLAELDLYLWYMETGKILK
ncbi:MAG: N-glycosylase/DNA lyase [Candidatus Korarchaeota archaeon]|nr:N-glycosylase/DNA lyase [Candidatus Korarchaeota archaeon]